MGKVMHDGSEAAKYFIKGLEYVHRYPRQRWSFGRSIRTERGSISPEMEYSRDVLVARTSKESIQWLETRFADALDLGWPVDRMTIVIVEYYRDSMIQKGYLRNRMLRGYKGNKEPDFMMVEFRESDAVVRLEDEYDGKFSYRNLSGHYRKQLHRIAERITVKESNREMGSLKPDSLEAGGGKYADSSLVQ